MDKPSCIYKHKPIAKHIFTFALILTGSGSFIYIFETCLTSIDRKVAHLNIVL